MGHKASDIELWKDLTGWEDRYSISNIGRVLSKSFLKVSKNKHGPISFTTKSKILKHRLNADGYQVVDLHRPNLKLKSVLVHRLVALEFLDNFEDLPFVNHKNSIRDDNKVQNLEWCTQKHNVSHGYKTGNNSNLGVLHPRHVLCDKIVCEMRKMRKEGSKVLEVASYFGFRADTTASAIRGKNWGHVKCYLGENDGCVCV